MKITTEVSNEVHKKLQEQARTNGRSLTKEVGQILKNWVTNPEQFINLHDTNLAEGSTIKTKITRPKTPEEIEEEQITHFQKLAKQILDHELDISENALDPTNRYYEFATPQEEGKFLRWPYTMSEQKQREYLEEWKQYE